MYQNNFIAVIKHEGKILRELDGEVSLPFNSQYSILLKNKDSRRVLVDIDVDGENVLAGKSLIIDGNSSQEIKGFMRNMSITNRFKFIHKTKEISNHRGDRIDDGIISVSYRFEKEKIQPIKIMRDWREPFPYPKPCPGRCPDIKYNCNTPLTEINTAGPLMSSCYTGISTSDIVAQNYSEDGITVKGSKITQEYQYGDIDDLEHRTCTITLRLKGQVKRSKKIITKPLTVKTKLRCPTCGRRSKSSSTFCYNCGTYLR